MNFSNIRFENYETYDGILGAIYTPAKTTFRLWAPTAERIQLKLYTTGSHKEPGAKDLDIVDMIKDINGTWLHECYYDCKNLYYTYLVTINGLTNEVVDIYAKAVGVNGNRGMIIDLPSTNPENWENDKRKICRAQTDAVIWEIHIKDFSWNHNSGISDKNRGKFLAFTEKNSTLNDKGTIKTCINYLKNLGITHVHLLPTFDQGFLDETTNDPESFNWGYDPKNYNVPEGSYSSNPYDGNVRVKEFKQMVQSLHSENIGVIMDVVYNHTADSENSWFNLTVPGYYHRKNEDGTFSNGSGCGNETASERPMCRKYIMDSLIYWATEYHIDGFRFDLMGLHDVETMNLIREALDKHPDGKNILLYGEPWCGGPSALKWPHKSASKDNAKELSPRVACFNDNFRDIIPGRILSDTDKDNAGFIQGAPHMETKVKVGISGHVSIKHRDFSWDNRWAVQPSQVVTYISAHDNLTFYDKLVLSQNDGKDYDKYHEKLVAENKLAAAIYLTSQGMIFMQAGEEFARTKFGDHNSYNSKASINAINWENAEIFKDLSEYYKGLLQIRKAFSPFRDSTTNSILNMNFILDIPKNVVSYTLENTINPKDEWHTVALLFNSNDTPETITLVPPEGGTLPKEWVLIANKEIAGLKPIRVIKGLNIEVPGKSAMILVDKESFFKFY